MRRGSEGLGEAGLTQNGVGRVTARDTDRHGEASLRNRALPDYVAAASLADQRTTGFPKKLPEFPIELRRHQAAAGSASRIAVIWTKTDPGSTPK